jgi:hypothetical protein
MWGKMLPKQIQVNIDDRNTVQKMNNKFKQEQVMAQAQAKVDGILRKHN